MFARLAIASSTDLSINARSSLGVAYLATTS